MYDEQPEPSLREQVTPVLALCGMILFGAGVFWFMLPLAR